MQLDIIFETQTLGDLRQEINMYFGQEMKVKCEQLLLFESYQVRPTQMHIMEMRKYRIVAKDGKYIFGKLRRNYGRKNENFKIVSWNCRYGFTDVD